MEWSNWEFQWVIINIRVIDSHQNKLLIKIVFKIVFQVSEEGEEIYWRLNVKKYSNWENGIKLEPEDTVEEYFFGRREQLAPEYYYPGKTCHPVQILSI